MSIFCIEKGASFICASIPIATTEPLPLAFTFGVAILTPVEYSAVVLYSLTPYSAGTVSPLAN